MVRRSCDGTGLLEAFRAAVANLEAHVDEINSLNVFPVPDGDTGTNMVATVKAALEEADGVAGQPVDRVAAALSFGALMGARGNSGVITSQILRGLSEGLAGKRRFNGLDLAYALSLGTKTAYGAVTRPVEGTILTVIREAADAAVAAAERDEDVEAVLTATVDAAEKSVARTPTLLAILREAGVVDSGGQGLYRMFQGALQHLSTGGRPASRRRSDAARPRASTLVAHADEGYGYETMFLLQATAGRPIDIDALRAYLEEIGDSVLVAGDSKALKVHVHNDRPDLVIARGLTLGTLSRISVENLDNQARDVREARAASFTGEPAADPGPHTAASDPPTPEASPNPATTPASPLGTAVVAPSTNGSGPALTTEPTDGALRLAVVAVAAGDGLAAIFEDFGVSAVVHGGQSANPSTGELLEAIERTNADEVVVLPNNPNVVLAARQVAAMASRPVAVIPTRNAAEGYAALLCMDPGASADANAGPMADAARSIQTLQVTEAVRDATIGSKKVKRGQTIALDPDEGLVAAGNDRMRAILDAIGRLTPGFELVTVFYGKEAHLDEAEEVARRIQGQLTGVDVELRHGGQPHYRYLISAE